MNQTKFVSPVFGGRDDYQVQLALFEHNLLSKIIVEMRPTGVNWLNKVAKNYQSKERNTTIPSKCFEIEWHAFIEEIKRKVKTRARIGNPYYSWLESARYLGEYAGKYARNHNNNVLADLYSGGGCFDALSGYSTKKVLFQTHPYILYLERLYSDFLHLDHQQTISRYPLKSEPDLGAPTEHIEALKNAPLEADLLICASTFTKNTLIESGVPPEKIEIAEYGVDTSQFYPRKVRRKISEEPFRLIYIGQSSTRKNIGSLVNAWSDCNLRNSELILVGGDFQVGNNVANINNIVCKGRVTDEMLRILIAESDALILPSIAEGFGLVILQSLACGVPVIASENTGLSDIIKLFDVGKVVPTQQLEDLADYVLWAYNNRQLLAEKRDVCLAAAKYYTWDRFRNRVFAAVSERV